MSSPEPAPLLAAETAFELAIRAMGQALVDASAAAHEIDALDPPKDDQDADYDRLLWLGKNHPWPSPLVTPRPGGFSPLPPEVLPLEQPRPPPAKPPTAPSDSRANPDRNASPPDSHVPP